MRCIASAIPRTCAADSITQGPAIKNSRPSPTRTGPISNEDLTKPILPAANHGWVPQVSILRPGRPRVSLASHHRARFIPQPHRGMSVNDKLRQPNNLTTTDSVTTAPGHDPAHGAAKGP